MRGITNNLAILCRAFAANPTINGATPLPESSQVGTSQPRPTPSGSCGGGPQGGLGSSK